MNATRIPKDGRYLHHYCKDCKGDEVHLIQVAEYRKNTVLYNYFCQRCSKKWEALNKIKLAEEDFYGTVGEMTNEKWNEFNVWGDYE